MVPLVIDYTEEELREDEFSHVCWSNCPAGCQRQLVLELQRQVQSFAPYMTPSSSPVGGVSGLQRLPTEVFCMILKYLAPLHLVALMFTCHSFYDVLDYAMLERCAATPGIHSLAPWFYKDVEPSKRQHWLIEHGFACASCFTVFCGSPSSWRDDWHRSSTRRKLLELVSHTLPWDHERPYLRLEDCASVPQRRIYHEPSGLFACPTCIVSRTWCDVSNVYAQNIMRFDQADLAMLKHEEASFRCHVEGKSNRVQFYWIGLLKDHQCLKAFRDEEERQRAYEAEFGCVPQPARRPAGSVMLAGWDEERVRCW